MGAEKLVLLAKLETMNTTLQTQKDHSTAVKDAALNALIATHAVELCNKFREGAKFTQELLGK